MKNEIKETKYKGYWVTSHGQFLSTKVPGGQGREDGIFRTRALKIDRYGYLIAIVSLIDENGKHIMKHIPLHRLIYETFKGPLIDGMTIDHINNNKINNRIDNLKQISWVENSTKRDKTHHFGNQNRFIVEDHNTHESFIMTCSEISSKYNIPRKTINGIIFKRFNTISDYYKNKGINITVKRVEDIEKVSNT